MCDYTNIEPLIAAFVHEEKNDSHHMDENGAKEVAGTDVEATP